MIDLSIRDEVNRYYSELLEGRCDVDDPPNWHEILGRKGYVSMPVHGIFGPKQHAEMQLWCQEFIGQDYYVKIGNVMWFENHKLATLFALKWIK